MPLAYMIQGSGFAVPSLTFPDRSPEAHLPFPPIDYRGYGKGLNMSDARRSFDAWITGGQDAGRNPEGLRVLGANSPELAANQ